jgi:hypothetical protein
MAGRPTSSFLVSDTAVYGRKLRAIQMTGRIPAQRWGAASGSASSPRMRGVCECPDRPGKVLRITPAYAGSIPGPAGAAGRVWITPACAGSTSPCRAAASARTEHPRAYGEHCSSVTGTSWPHGSPPRVRGARIGPVNARSDVWVTPVHTGRALSDQGRCWRLRDWLLLPIETHRLYRTSHGRRPTSFCLTGRSRGDPGESGRG